MTTFRVEEGDFREIIDSPDAEDVEQGWLVEVEQGRCRLVHSRESATRGEGDRLYQGDRTKVQNLRGDGLWAVAETGFGDVVLNVSRASAELDLQVRTDDQVIGSVRAIEQNDPELIANQETMIDLLEQIEENTRS